MNKTKMNDRETLAVVARKAMAACGMEPNLSPEAQEELAKIKCAALPGQDIRDMRTALWSSIDNDDSRDLDQLTAAEALDNGCVRVLVAIADVDALVSKGSALDQFAQRNTTSVYTPAVIFPMIPEMLSTDLTSLNENEDRIALVVDMTFNEKALRVASSVYRALVRNHAKLTYNGVAAWLDDASPVPEEVTRISGLEDNIRLQDSIAQRLARYRQENGALSLETLATKTIFAGDNISKVAVEQSNRAMMLIEDLMIAANSATAAFLTDKGFPSVRRVLRCPERWDRIRQLAGEHSYELPEQPDGKALEAFLSHQQKAAPDTFADLSLSIVKLIGRGEYAIEVPGKDGEGHFGLAVRDYAHSTAPNRRYPDLITHRLLKAAMSDSPMPYTIEELAAIAYHCTQQEDMATKVERRVRKSAQALFMSPHLRQSFEGVITGASERGTWVRIFNPPMEGQIVTGGQGVSVGEHVTVKLLRTNIDRGFIDFGRYSTPAPRSSRPRSRRRSARMRPKSGRPLNSQPRRVVADHE